MKATNFCQLIGYLGSDPKVITTGEGKILASFSIATNESFKDSNGDAQERTDWHNVVAFGKTAQLAEKYLTRGSRVLVSGKLQTRTYVDKKEVQRYTTECIANSLVFLDQKKAN